MSRPAPAKGNLQAARASVGRLTGRIISTIRPDEPARHAHKDAAARRAAKRAGLIAKKSRRHLGSFNNQGGFRLIEPRTNAVVDGSRFELDADDVIRICRERSEDHGKEFHQ